MTSHAVKRKKARQEKKHTSMKDQQGVAVKKKVPFYRQGEIDDEIRQQQQQLSDEQRAGRNAAAVSERPTKIPSAPPKKVIVAPPVAATPEAPEIPEDASRKERRKLAASSKLEKTLHKMSTQAQRAEELAAEHGPNASAGAFARHDTKHLTGQFWKERKDKKKRTLFVGNVPAAWSDSGELRDVISSVSDSGDASCVEGIDWLGKTQNKAQQRHARVKHCYVTFVTLEAARAAQILLDGMPTDTTGTTPGGGGKQSNRTNCLRVNFSDDKQQRSEAIQRRSGGHQQQQQRGQQYRK